MSIIYINPYQLPPTDPYFANVSLLLHGDGTDGSTTIIDSSPSPKAVTAVGNAQISSAQSKFGGASIAFDGSGDWLTVASSADLSLGTGDFTVELWAYANSATTWNGLVGNRTGRGGDNAWCIILSPANVVGWGTIYFHTDGTPVLGTSAHVSLNTWMHIALTRSGTLMRMFLNGAEVGTVNNSFNLSFSTLHVGSEGARTDQSSPFNGYIDDLRITKGVARYTSNFTPQTSQWQNQ